MSLPLDVALREIYFNVNGAYMSMEKLYQKAKEEGIWGVSRKNVRERLQTQNTYIIHKPSRKHYKTQRTYVDGLAQHIQMDLVDMSKFSYKNKGNRWILTVMGVLAKPVCLCRSRMEEKYRKHDEGCRKCARTI